MGGLTEIREADRSRASGPPSSSEHKGEAYMPKAATRSRGWSASEPGQRSVAVRMA